LNGIRTKKTQKHLKLKFSIERSSNSYMTLCISWKNP